MYHIFFIHSSVEGHLGCFHVLAIARSAAVNTGVHVSFQIRVFIFSGKHFFINGRKVTVFGFVVTYNLCLYFLFFYLCNSLKMWKPLLVLWQYQTR